MPRYLQAQTQLALMQSSEDDVKQKEKKQVTQNLVSALKTILQLMNNPLVADNQER